MKDKVLIIYYHEVVDDGNGFSYQKIETTKFREQMKYLADNGYCSLLFSELNKSIPEKSVIISFDDGFESVYNKAAPIMKEYGMKGNVYLPTAYIGNNEKFMNWDMVGKLISEYGFEMQAHTHNHVDIRGLTKEQLAEEISVSKNIFEEKIQYGPIAFCVPFGTYDKRSAKTLIESKEYKYILGSFYGRVKQSKIDNKILPRIGISNDDSMKDFIKKLKGGYDWKGPIQRLRLLISSIQGKRITEYEY